MTEAGTAACQPSPPLCVYPPILKARPNAVSCGPYAPIWHEVHGWPVCKAKLGTARKAVQRCRLGRSESSVQHPGTEVKRMATRRIPESEKV